MLQIVAVNDIQSLFPLYLLLKSNGGNPAIPPGDVLAMQFFLHPGCPSRHHQDDETFLGDRESWTKPSFVTVNLGGG